MSAMPESPSHPSEGSCSLRVRFLLSLCFLGAWVLAAAPSQATVIEQSSSLIAGNRYEFSFSVSNDTLAVPIEEFAILFDFNVFENLGDVVAPADWDPIVFQPDLGLSSDGIFDAFALGAGIGVGATLGGFSVQADFLGVDLPLSLPFEILDPVTFDVVDSGSTAVTQTAVPEPSSALVVGGVVSGFFVARRRRRKHEAQAILPRNRLSGSRHVGMNGVFGLK